MAHEFLVATIEWIGLFFMGTFGAVLQKMADALALVRGLEADGFLLVLLGLVVVRTLVVAVCS